MVNSAFDKWTFHLPICTSIANWINQLVNSTQLFLFVCYLGLIGKGIGTPAICQWEFIHLTKLPNCNKKTTYNSPNFDNHIIWTRFYQKTLIRQIIDQIIMC